MCGIFGWASPTELEERRCRSALDTLAHRGPDTQGIYLSPDRGVALGHRRLSVIDLSPAGRQPMTNEDGTLWITCNGEIYNHPELRERLIAKGHRFSSKSDTEVILHLYEERGEEAVHELEGMFSFGLYDKTKGRLLLARDRLGIKPLYYAQHGGSLLFASEIKALLACDFLPVEMNRQAILDYFTFLFVPHPQTAFQGIFQLSPATLLSFDLKNRQATLRRYWTPWSTGTGNGVPLSREGLKEQLRERLTEAVRQEMISDVPVGLFFSGGIDSTLLAALMGRHSKERVKTFTVGFRTEGKDPHDDLPYARLAAKALGTEHRELILDPPPIEEILGLVHYFDQPFANPTFHIQHRIARESRKFVTVALSGVGSDELFGGYPKYRLFPWASLLRILPSGPAQAARRLAGRFPEDSWSPVLRRAKRLLRGVGVPFEEQYLRWSYYLSEEEKRALLGDRMEAGPPFSPTSRLLREAFSGLPPEVDPAGCIFYAELQTFLAGNLLEYTDKMTMSVALETRVPFLNHRLVELSARIPFQDKIRWGQSKVLLTETFGDLIPPEIVRAPKRGFSPPLGEWMRKVLDSYFERVMTEPVVREEGLFHWEAIQKIRQEHRSRHRDASMELLGIILFDVWFRRYIVRAPNPLEALP